MKDKRSNLQQLFTVIFGIGLLFSTLNSNAQNTPIDNDKLQVSYTYNFAKNIQWPNERSLQNFKIALFQVDSPELINEFNKLNGTQIKNIPIQIRQTNNINTLVNYDLIYVGTNTESVINNINNIIQGLPILMVSNQVENKRLVMLNLFPTENQQLQFEVNKANILNNNLTPLPELILLGGTEIDIAKLYRQGQASLIELQNQLNRQQAEFITLQSKITNQQNINNRLVNQMQNLSNDINTMRKINDKLNIELENLNLTIAESKKTIAESDKKIAESENIIAESAKTIAQQQMEIANSQRQKEELVTQVARRNKELDAKQAELLQRQEKLEAISRTINNKEAELISLNNTIANQQYQLEEQRQSIKELDQLVEAQQRSLYFLWAMVAAFIALFTVIIAAYRIKRRDNDRLARHSHDLQVARDRLEVAKRKAEAANRAKGAFLSLMSHELRTPLQSIIGYTDLMIEDLKLDGNDAYIDQLVRVNTNGERLLELINNTLDLAKIEAGKMKVELSPTNLRAVVDEAIDNVKPLLTKNKNQLVISINNQQHTPNLDYHKLLHMLVNLLSNANKFTQKGTITITVDNQPKKLTLIVSDTGIGLTKEQLSYIFNRFHQANNSKNKIIKGTGLGLSITQHFSEIMGGTIHAESEPGGGADFIVEIPLPVVITEKKFVVIDDPEEAAA